MQIEDNTGSLELLFFNGKFLESYFKPGEQTTFFRKIIAHNGRRQMAHPEFHKLGMRRMPEGRSCLPIDRGSDAANLRAWQQQARGATGRLTEWSAFELVETHHAQSAYAIEQIYFPQEERPVLESRYRLIFEELLILQTGLFYMKHGASDVKRGHASAKEADVGAVFLSSFPFQLTAGQARCWHEIERDLESARPMNRLIQGDGAPVRLPSRSLAMYKAVKSGYQAR